MNPNNNGAPGTLAPHHITFADRTDRVINRKPEAMVVASEKKVNFAFMGKEAEQTPLKMFRADWAPPGFPPAALDRLLTHHMYRWLLYGTICQRTLGFDQGVRLELIRRKCLYGTSHAHITWFFDCVAGNRAIRTIDNNPIYTIVNPADEPNAVDIANQQDEKKKRNYRFRVTQFGIDMTLQFTNVFTGLWIGPRFMEHWNKMIDTWPGTEYTDNVRQIFDAPNTNSEMRNRMATYYCKSKRAQQMLILLYDQQGWVAEAEIRAYWTADVQERDLQNDTHTGQIRNESSFATYLSSNHDVVESKLNNDNTKYFRIRARHWVHLPHPFPDNPPDAPQPPPPPPAAPNFVGMMNQQGHQLAQLQLQGELVNGGVFIDPNNNGQGGGNGGQGGANGGQGGANGGQGGANGGQGGGDGQAIALSYNNNEQGDAGGENNEEGGGNVERNDGQDDSDGDNIPNAMIVVDLTQSSSDSSEGEQSVSVLDLTQSSDSSEGEQAGAVY